MRTALAGILLALVAGCGVPEDVVEADTSEASESSSGGEAEDVADADLDAPSDDRDGRPEDSTGPAPDEGLDTAPADSPDVVDDSEFIETLDDFGAQTDDVDASDMGPDADLVQPEVGEWGDAKLDDIPELEDITDASVEDAADAPLLPPCPAAGIEAEAFGGDSIEQGFGLVAAGDGALLVGHRQVPGLFSEGMARRVDSAGVVVWETVVTGPSFDVFEGVAADPLGAFAVAGYRGSPGLGTTDAWLVGLAEDGAVEWEVEAGGGGDDYLRAVLRRSVGGWLAVGTDADAVTATTDVLIMAVDDAGEVLWKKKHGGLGSEYGFDAVETPNGFALVGTRRDGSGDTNGLILLVDHDGALLHSVTAGGIGEDTLRAVTLRDDGMLVAGGIWDVDGIDNDVWLLGVTQDGGVVWEATLGGTDHEDLRGLAPLPGGGVLASANTSSEGAGLSDAWILTLGPSGALLGKRLAGGSGHDVAHRIVLGASGQALAVGYTGSDVPVAFNQWFLRVELVACPD